MTLEKGDFIQVTYTGKINNEEKKVFDTTDAEVAKKEEIFDPKSTYGPITIVLGQHHVLSGLDKGLIGKEIGTYTLEIEAKDGFGLKSAKKLELVPAKFFKKENIRPFVGLQVNIDNQIGVVRSISGGRVIVDFNHPLASQDLVYDITVHKKVKNPADQVKAIFALYGLALGDDVTVEGDKAVISTKSQLPTEFTKPLIEMIQNLTKVKTVEFVLSKQEAKSTEKKQEAKADAKVESQPAQKEEAKPSKTE
ncbi:MAG: FKBP-type peptidyl-prolyl cis-trans isomerase [Candidatus Nanoarchaeia archaeon]